MYNNKRIIQYFMNERNQACWICAITVTLYVQSLPGRKEKDFSPCRLFPFLRRGLCKRNKSLSQAKLMVGRRRHSTGPDKFNEMKSGAWHTRERERERETGRQTTPPPAVSRSNERKPVGKNNVRWPTRKVMTKQLN